jgi:CBS domain-containing protein
MVAAFFIVQGLRLRNQAVPGLGEERANRVDPDTLNELERNVLKEAFGQARRLQSRLGLDYQV